MVLGWICWDMVLDWLINGGFASVWLVGDGNKDWRTDWSTSWAQVIHRKMTDYFPSIEGKITLKVDTRQISILGYYRLAIGFILWSLICLFEKSFLKRDSFRCVAAIVQRVCYSSIALWNHVNFPYNYCNSDSFVVSKGECIRLLLFSLF